MKTTLLHALCTAAILLSATDAGATGPNVALVRQLTDQAYDLLEKGDYAGAIEAIRAAEKESRAPSLTVISAEAHEKLGKLADAQRLYQGVVAVNIALLTPPPGVNRWKWLPAQKEAQEFAAAELLKLMPRVPHLAITVTGADLGAVRVTVGGESFDAAELGREVPWNPGKYTVVAEIPDKEKATTEVELKEGEKKSVTLVLNRPPPPKPGISIPVGPTIAFGVAGVALVTGIISGAIATEDASITRELCATRDTHPSGRTCPDFYYSALTMSRVSTVAFLVAGAGAAVGVTLLLLPEKKADPPGKKAEPGTVGVSIGPGFVGLTGRF